MVCCGISVNSLPICYIHGRFEDSFRLVQGSFLFKQQRNHSVSPLLRLHHFGQSLAIGSLKVGFSHHTILLVDSAYQIKQNWKKILRIFPKKKISVNYIVDERKCTSRNPSCMSRFVCTLIVFFIYIVCSCLVYTKTLTFATYLKDLGEAFNNSTSSVICCIGTGVCVYQPMHSRRHENQSMDNLVNLSVNKNKKGNIYLLPLIL